ncbi:MAG: serine/threonine protein kinase [Ignavibacteria bacterium GWA2_55_11]|nr:MAG: serine/threonine protein kinase [Ignavibacteria bacterium GWA2_55_11]OGU45455.1 MAG: serine/threonine protein kinase [Ignavibacteria bacterium GWC2_56_12]OGU66010.1 MAG: serine/threonine protein kinase [Ignavibacteria bacterium RIFCSPHIGHO2_02_FULL_56_12]OGU73535.1 MAG: serine/threonine protein kinase [Ignavibacteria bacterium RIFCSPLOWO2_02_FULL_55_14]OGU76538.1 MAG: serine/threonine protein kinase [Ignavibacteria bacterium RIFCSPLOWO2_12_FULL_56_21]HAV22669.1 ATP-binding protein [Bac
MRDELAIHIASDADIVKARQEGRALAERIGFSGSDLTIIATAISEVARNIIKFAKRGEIVLQRVDRNPRDGILVIARDDGPGIPDIPLAMQDGFTTGHGLGLGLPGCRRLMDEFAIESSVGEGTTVSMKKWVSS